VSTTVQVLAIVVGVMLTSVWIMEAFFYRSRRLYPMFLIEPREYDAVRMWTVNVGFYNLTTAVAMFVGVGLARNGHAEAGEALVYFTAAQHIFLALVLLATRPKLWLNSIMESALGIVLLTVALS